MSNLNKEIFFKRFYLENYNQVYFYAFKRIGNSEVSKDIVSEAFTYIWENFEKINKETIRQYLYKYIYNKCVDYYRHSVVEKKYISLLLKIEEEEYTTDIREEDNRMRRIKKVSQTFSERTYSVFYKCFIEQKKYKEVAIELSITVGGVKKHIIKTLKAFREEFDNDLLPK